MYRRVYSAQAGSRQNPNPSAGTQRPSARSRTASGGGSAQSMNINAPKQQDPQLIDSPPQAPKPQPPPQKTTAQAVSSENILKSLFNKIPKSIYNRETGKLLGILTAEDLMLIALILMIADSDDNEDMALLIALVYILIA